MKLIRPTPNGANPRLSTIRGGAPKKLNWYQERIEDRPRFVLLACGHRSNIAIRATVILNLISGVEIYCDRCKEFSRIKKKLRLLEYHGIKRVRTPDVPLY